jgi:hypothetical protein
MMILKLEAKGLLYHLYSTRKYLARMARKE